jgi:hypothetical protein
MGMIVGFGIMAGMPVVVVSVSFPVMPVIMPMPGGPVMHIGVIMLVDMVMTVDMIVVVTVFYIAMKMFMIVDMGMVVIVLMFVFAFHGNTSCMYEINYCNASGYS